MRPTYKIVEDLLKGDASCLTQEVIYNINQEVLSLIHKPQLTKVEQEIVDDILRISNIIYNNTDRSILVLEDGIYDMLLEKYRKYNPNFQVGAEPVTINKFNEPDSVEQMEDPNDSLFVQMPYVNSKDMLFGGSILDQKDLYGNSLFSDTRDSNVSKRLKTSSHKYPKLVGTLNKAKFVLDIDASRRGVLDDTNVRVFERDFLRKHVQEGIVNPNYIELVLELKYDGVSVEAEVTDRIISARTRGDTQMDKASDLTPILKGYTFTRAQGYDIKPFGMKFEAVISYRDLINLSRECGKNYVNPRNAIIGILGNSEAAKLAKYITLVPLATSHDSMNRLEELAFMNQYYSTGEMCRHVVVSGDYNTVLFQVKKFVEEAEALRDVMPFMYDGVVVSYLDQNIRNRLGRKNSINEYSVAIKFNTKKKITRCRNITYTVGANGTVTPMIWYDPVEFYGAINTKSSGHSYARFRELSLKPNDVIEIEYMNDVIAYVRKPNIEENIYNPMPYFQFPTNCPLCGQPLVISETGKNASCMNMACQGRVVGRVTNMINKLGFKGFSEETVKQLGIESFYDLMTLTKEKTDILGPTNSSNLIEAIEQLYNTPMPDYIMLGSLGFTDIAATKWSNILKKVSLNDVIKESDTKLLFVMTSKNKGIGTKTANTIIKERKFFMKDLLYIYNMPNIVFTKGGNDEQIILRKTIRFSGVRDKDLEMSLISSGHDCSEGSVTKSTDILLIPYIGFNSTKVSKALEYNSKDSKHQIKIIPLDEFKLNMSQYLSEF